MNPRLPLLLALLSGGLLFTGCPAGDDDDSAATDDDDATSDDDDATGDDDDATGDDDDATGDDDDATGDDDDSGTEDVDGDGSPAGTDCDDADPENFPGNVEDCFDDQDNDCDGLVDLAQTGDQYLALNGGFATFDGPIVDYSAGFTLEAWIDLGQAYSGGDHRWLWHKGGGGGGEGAYVVFDSYGGGEAGAVGAPQLEMRGDQEQAGTTTASSGASTVAMGWHHVAMVVDAGTETTSYYMDGVLLTTEQILDGSIFAAPIEPEGDLWLGSCCNAGGTFGRIDNARLWSGTRTATQIQESLCAAVPASSPGLIYNLDFESETLADADVGPQALVGSSSLTTFGSHIE